MGDTNVKDRRVTTGPISISPTKALKNEWNRTEFIEPIDTHEALSALLTESAKDCNAFPVMRIS